MGEEHPLAYQELLLVLATAYLASFLLTSPIYQERKYNVKFKLSFILWKKKKYFLKNKTLMSIFKIIN
jgi:hypothetical protein